MTVNKVDIIITTRNRREDLLRTLHLLKEEKFPIDQVFVIDDGSEDQTMEEVEKHFPSVNILGNSTSQGLIKNRNKLIENTKNNYILSLDDDSCFVNVADLTFAIRALENEEDAGIFAFSIINTVEPLQKRKISCETRPPSFYCKSFTGCGFLLKKEKFYTLGRLKEELVFYGEEEDYSIRAFQKGIRIISNSSCIIHHRVNHKLRQSTILSDLKKGKYGAVWRNSNQFANNIIIAHIYYPRILLPVFLMRNSFSFFKISRNSAIILKGFQIFNERRKTIDVNEHKRLTFKQFVQFFRIPNHLSL